MLEDRVLKDRSAVEFLGHCDIRTSEAYQVFDGAL
jgi:hypothetical protein